MFKKSWGMPLSLWGYSLMSVAVLAHSLLAFSPPGMALHGKKSFSLTRQGLTKSSTKAWLGPLSKQLPGRPRRGDATHLHMLDSWPHPTEDGLASRLVHPAASTVLTTRHTEHHKDKAVLRSQILDEPIESGKEPISMEWLKAKAKVEGWTWAVTAGVALMLSAGASSPVPGQFMLAMEAMFLAYTLNQAKEMNRPSVPEPVTRDLRELWELCISTVHEGPEAFLRGWFYDAPVDSITLEDLQDFLAWAQFSTTYAQLSSTNQHALAGVVEIFEEKLQMTFRHRMAGEEPVASMRFTIEPMEYVHKPTLFYLSTKYALGGLTQFKLRTSGFTRHSKGEFNYWMRVPKSEAAKRKVPLVFFHGIGVGLVMYLNFVEQLLQTHDGPILLVELPFVSSQSAHVPSIDQQLHSMKAILDEWNIDKALFMGHSYGSVMLSWMIHHAPSRVAGVAFIDPVVMLLNRKDILYNFLYKREGEGQISDIVGTELYVNFSLRRHFWWYRNILWAQDIQASNVPSLVCLSEHDEIVPSDAVQQHINEHEHKVGKEANMVQSFMMDEANHGQILFDPALASLLATRLGTFVREVDRTVARRRGAVREREEDEAQRVDWLLTKGRWRMRQVGRAAAGLQGPKEVGAAAALMCMCLGGWQLAVLL